MVTFEEAARAQGVGINENILVKRLDFLILGIILMEEDIRG